MDQKFGKYRVTEKIGEGGFGTIYRGFDPHIKRTVAIKTCTTDDAEIKQRFSQEAQIAGNLHHRNITTMFDFGIHEDTPFLVQEYLNGEDLDRKIKRKDPLLLTEKIVHLIQIARGLEYAHSQGVVHRDVKPANIRILDDGTAKIMDFGIAKLANQDTGLTQTGMTLGTAAYLAPEQIRGEAVDARTDIFSFGVLAYELMCYRRPFRGQHISTVLFQILNEDPPAITDMAPDCPESMQNIILRCLEKSPSRRYPSCAELLTDLDTVLRVGGDGVTVTGQLQRSAVGAPRERTETRAVPSTATEAHVAPSRREVAELELSSIEDRTPHSISSTQAMRHRGFSIVPWAISFISLALLAAGGTWWWFHRPEVDSTVAESTLENPPDTTDEGSGGAGVETGSVQGDGDESAGPAEGDGTGEEASGDPASPGDEIGAPIEETPPPPPPEPKPGTITIQPPAWTDSIRVRFGGAWHDLGSTPFSRRVDPGTYRIDFEYANGDYFDNRSTQVEVAEGQAVTVRTPILEPALLTVQPRLGTPQGWIYLRRELLGQTVRDRMTAPGNQELYIREEQGEGTSISQPVKLISGVRTVVTFNLDPSSFRVVSISPPESMELDPP